ncbi:hypothetical protein [Paracoccus aminovorans]|nr:hypothetical protein [Paracoccus aminovorans]
MLNPLGAGGPLSLLAGEQGFDSPSIRLAKAPKFGDFLAIR